MNIRDLLHKALKSLSRPRAGSVLAYIPHDEPDPHVHGIKRVGSPDDIAAPLRWLEPTGTPLGVPALDCRSITRGSISTAQTADQLEQYVALRNHTGADLRHLHLDGRSSQCSLTYVLPMPPLEGRLYSSRRLEYKWDIALWGTALLFSRSWTGDLIYRAETTLDGSILKISSVEATQDAGTPESTAAFDVAAVDFLVRSHLLRVTAPHPLPPSLRSLPEKSLALWSMAFFGCEARFGYILENAA